MLVAEGAQAAQERGRGRRVAAFALDRLDEDRGDRVGRRDRLGELAEVAEAALGRGGLVAVEVAVGGGKGEQVHARQERLVAPPVVDVGARHRRRSERPAVEAAPVGDDPRPARGPSGELERGLDRLRARVHEEHRVEGLRERGRELVRQADRGLRVAHRHRRRDELVDLLVDRRRDRRMVMAQGRDGDPVGEVEVRLAGRVVHPVALAMAPAALEIAPQDRRHVRSGERGEIDGVGRGRGGRVLVGRHGCPRQGRCGEASRVYGEGRLVGRGRPPRPRPSRRRPPRLVEWPDPARSPRALPKPRSDRDRLLAHGREPSRPAERPRLRRGRDPAPHPGMGFEGRGPSRGLRPDGRARLPRRADPRGLRRLRDGLHQLRDPVRGARAGRHGVPGRPERPRRPELAGPAAVGQRGAAAALPRAPGTRREARHVRAHGARRRAPTPGRSRRRPAGRATRTASTVRRSGSAWPTSPTTSSSSPRSIGRRSIAA